MPETARDGQQAQEGPVLVLLSGFAEGPVPPALPRSEATPPATARDGEQAEIGPVPPALPRSEATPPATARDGEQAETGPMPPAPPRSEATPPAIAQDGEQAEIGPVPPAPHVSGMLTVLPPFELTAVELGMQQFLQQMERMGRRLAGHRDGTGPYLWIVAGAVAAMACEIARRQLRQPAGVLASERNRMPDPLPDRLFAG